MRKTQIAVLPLALFLVIASSVSFAQAPGEALVLERCTKCHTLERVCHKLDTLTEAQFLELVGRMVSHGANVDLKEQHIIAAHLAGQQAGASPICEAAAGVGLFGSPDKLEIIAANPLLFVHPFLMPFITLLALYVLYLGSKRFRSRHLKHRVQFPWKRHVQLGFLALTLWLAGMLAGAFVANAFFGQNGLTGFHFYNALAMLPFILFGGLTGLYMDSKKAHGDTLPLLHGINNTILFLMAAAQGVTGSLIVYHLLWPTA